MARKFISIVCPNIKEVWLVDLYLLCAHNGKEEWLVDSYLLCALMEKGSGSQIYIYCVH